MLKDVNPNDLRVRCSALNSVMAKATGSRKISVGAETYAKEWWIKQATGRIRLDHGSKQTQKGHANEAEGIEIVADLLGLFGAEKNETEYHGEFLTGTPDVVQPSLIIDIKSPWDVFTFPFFEQELDPAYHAQMQGYLHLTGRKKGIVAYVLTSAGLAAQDALAWKLARTEGFDEPESEHYEAANFALTFEDLPVQDRVKLFHVDYDPDFIASAEERVKQMRNWLASKI